MTDKPPTMRERLAMALIQAPASGARRELMNSLYFRVTAIMCMVLLAAVMFGFFWFITPH